jgi:hypothetical protein
VIVYGRPKVEKELQMERNSHNLASVHASLCIKKNGEAKVMKKEPGRQKRPGNRQGDPRGTKALEKQPKRRKTYTMPDLGILYWSKGVKKPLDTKTSAPLLKPSNDGHGVGNTTSRKATNARKTLKEE